MNHSENTEFGKLRQEVGELTGTLREVCLMTKATSAKVDDLSDVVGRQAECLRRTEMLEAGHLSQGERLDKLETYGHRRAGAVGVASWIAKYWPFSAMVALLMAVVAWANDKIG